LSQAVDTVASGSLTYFALLTPVGIIAIVAVLALIVALLALVRARGARRRLERLTESYWELRYEYGELRTRVERLENPSADPEGDQPARPAATAFVPLSSLKR
jgi:hypothetical protein